MTADRYEDTIFSDWSTNGSFLDTSVSLSQAAKWLIFDLFLPLFLAPKRSQPPQHSTRTLARLVANYGGHGSSRFSFDFGR